MGWQDLTAATNRTLAQAGAFGEAVQYSPFAGGGPLARSWPFDEEFEEIDADTGAGITSQRPNLLITLSELSAPPQRGDRFVRVRTGKTYSVDEIQKDGVGTVLALCTEAKT